VAQLLGASVPFAKCSHAAPALYTSYEPANLLFKRTGQDQPTETQDDLSAGISDYRDRVMVRVDHPGSG
jgi:hypothetical protein